MTKTNKSSIKWLLTIGYYCGKMMKIYYYIKAMKRKSRLYQAFQSEQERVGACKSLIIEVLLGAAG